MLQITDPQFDRETELSRMIKAQTMFTDFNIGY